MKQPAANNNERIATNNRGYEINNTKPTKNNRKRNIIWFNPPFCRLTNINIGKEFIRLVKKHFPHKNTLHKILNKNTLKISYSCTSNIQKIIQNHNKKIIKKSD